MKTEPAASGSIVVCAPGTHAREGLPKRLYLPKEAKARINRFAHQAAERHGQDVRNRIFESLGRLSTQGSSLPDLLAALEHMLHKSIVHNSKTESRNT